jgi:hypothetical protein
LSFQEEQPAVTAVQAVRLMVHRKSGAATQLNQRNWHAAIWAQAREKVILAPGYHLTSSLDGLAITGGVALG